MKWIVVLCGQFPACFVKNHCGPVFSVTSEECASRFTSSEKAIETARAHGLSDLDFTVVLADGHHSAGNQ